jgi:hypothetical protein
MGTWTRSDKIGLGSLIVGLVGVIAAIVVIPEFRERLALGTERRALADLKTELELDGTKWEGRYQDMDENGKLITRSGFISFRQYGSRVVGEARASEAARGWLIEGVAYKGRLCYTYVDTNPNVVSIGTASFELDRTGKKLVGYWTGWSPDGDRFEPRTIVLTKVQQ